MTDARRRRYVRRAGTPVVAVRLALDTDGFVYRKWGNQQRARAGDWLVDNNGDVYTVEAGVFAYTYRAVGPGQYVKATPIWAERAEAAGSVQTKEGLTNYQRGDYIVSNANDTSDQYAMTAEKFESLYELDEDDRT